MADHFLNPLPPISNRRQAGSHGLKISHSQSFIAAGQDKNIAPAQHLRHFLARPPPEKLYTPGNAEFPPPPLHPALLHALPNQARAKAGKLATQPPARSQRRIISL